MLNNHGHTEQTVIQKEFLKTGNEYLHLGQMIQRYLSHKLEIKRHTTELEWFWETWHYTYCGSCALLF